MDPESEFWKTIQNSQLPSDYKAYLNEYPQSRFAALARLKLRKLSGRSGQPAAPLSRRRPPGYLPKIALFPANDRRGDFGMGIAYQFQMAEPFGKLVRNPAHHYAISHSFYDLKIPAVIQLKFPKLNSRKYWDAGLFSTKPNLSVVVGAGKKLGVDYVLMYDLYFAGCGGTGALSTPFITYLINVHTRDMIRHQHMRECPAFGGPAKSAAIVKALLDKHVK